MSDKRDPTSTEARAGVAAGTGAAYKPGTITATGPGVNELERLKAPRWQAANSKKTNATALRVQRAIELRREGRSAAEIAVKLTYERNEPQRPAINERTVQKWFAKLKGTAVPGNADLP